MLYEFNFGQVYLLHFFILALQFLLIDYFKMGVYSLFVAALLSNPNAYFIAPLQYHQIVVNGKRGIWVR